MRGTPDPQLAMLTTLSTEDLIPVDHPIRRIRVVVDAVLAELDDTFDGMYAASGRRSIVGGHEIVPGGGHVGARWWPTVLPSCGQQFCPR